MSTSLTKAWAAMVPPPVGILDQLVILKNPFECKLLFCGFDFLIEVWFTSF